MKNRKLINQKIRKKRVRGKISGTAQKPRLSVFRSNRHIYAQIIDDVRRITIISFSDINLSGKDNKDKSKIEKAGQVGDMIGKSLKEKKINKLIFDRGSYKYHGRLKALAESVRKLGLKF